MRIERHIFGNVQGYKTLARSGGVDGEACRQLESLAFSFGQTNDHRFTQSLSVQTTFIVRELSGGRRSLTRVMEGQPDDNGRPTLLLISAILRRQDWDRQLLGQVRCLFDHDELWQWNHSDNVPTISVSSCPTPGSVPPQVAAKLLSLLSEIERRHGQPVCVSIGDYGPAELSVLEVLIPPAARPRVSIACGGLNPQFPATVVAPSPVAAAQAPTFHSGSLLGELSSYARHLADGGILRGTIPLERVMSYRGFGQENTYAAPATGDISPQPGKGTSLALIAGVAILSVIGSLSSYLLAHAQVENATRDWQEKASQTQQKLDAQQSQLRTEIDGLKDAIGQANARLGRTGQEATKSLSEARSQLQSHFDGKLADLTQRIQRLDGSVLEIRQQLTQRASATTQTTQPAKGGK